MRLLLLTLVFISFSVVSFAQDVTFMLTHGTRRKWTSVEKTSSPNSTGNMTLFFNGSHKVEYQPVNSLQNPFSQNWALLGGDNIFDEKITMQIGTTIYTVTFSKTSNGDDFMTLTYFRNDRAFTNSYYSE